MLSPLLLPASDDDGTTSTTLPRSDHGAGAPSPSSPTKYFPDPAIDNPTALETASWWAEFTSIHGAYYVLERGHTQLWKRVAWAAIVLATTVALIVALAGEFVDYYEYNVDTTTETVIPTSLDFPRVTLCNANGGVDAALQNATGTKEPRNEEELMAILQPLEDLILHTEFNQKVYDVKDAWTPAITPLGLCFSFVTDEKVFIPGTEAGLLVHTWLDQASYPDETKWAGVQVLVDPMVAPLQASGLVLVPPGATSFVALTRHDFQREEDEPWKGCISSDEGSSGSVERCRTECIMSTTRGKCGCRLMGDSDPNYDFCNSADSKCRSSIGDEDLGICLACAVPPCRERTYSTRYSTGRVSQKMAERIKTAQNASSDEMMLNFVSIHMNYDSIRYKRTTETKSTTPWQLVSNLGGSLGFFMGISMISLVELFVELFALRLAPRLWGKMSLYGIGQKKLD